MCELVNPVCDKCDAEVKDFCICDRTAEDIKKDFDDDFKKSWEYHERLFYEWSFEGNSI